MSPLRNKSLKDFNTFGIAATASHLISFSTVDELKQALVIPTQKRMILGGGSNLLFTQDFDGVVLKNEIKGISVINETPDYVTVTFGAGENWHDCVLHSINQGWGGIENLALIPGTVGAAPMQNIGAYGVEIKEVFHTLSAVNVKTQQI